MNQRGPTPPQLTVSADDRTVTLGLGATHSFGRECPTDSDDSFLAVGIDDTTVSRLHGTLEIHQDRWDATCTGRYVGFLIHDLESAAVIEVPAGAGTIGVPFAKALITIPARQRYVLEVDAPHLANSELSSAADSAGVETERANPVANTEPVIPEAACVDRSGRPLRWFQVLVALCEPRLLNPAGSLKVPTDADIRRRLGMGTSTFDRAFSRARSELGFAPYTHLVRLAMVSTAIHQGVVRLDHLAVLEPD